MEKQPQEKTTQIAPQAQPQAMAPRREQIENPFQRQAMADHVSHGAIAVESERAIAQVQAKVIMARKFPRSPAACFENIREACRNLSLAEAAFFSFPRGGEVVHGPTIRLAEELASIWGNIEISVIELSRREGETELQASAWDLESNVSSSVNFTVKHALDLKSGSKELTAQRDISDLTANVAARKLRGRILSILPEALVSAAVDMCRDTLARSISADLADKRAAIVAHLRKMGITERAICVRFSVDKVEKLDARAVSSLASIARTIKAGEASAAEIFEQGITAEDVARRKQERPQEKPQEPAQGQPGRSGSVDTSTAQEGHVAPREPQAEPTGGPAERQESGQASPKKGSAAWYRSQLVALGAKAAESASLRELQDAYGAALEKKLAETRGPVEESEPEPQAPVAPEKKKPAQAPAPAPLQKQKPAPAPAPAPASDDDWFNE